MQEVFRSIEDIHGLMCMVNKRPKPQMMETYYSKLTNTFWISKIHLYHAHAWYNLYILHKSYNKNLAQKDLQLMASFLLLASISIIPYDYKHGDHHFELQNEKERSSRMVSLLGFSLDSKKDTREVVGYFNGRGAYVVV